MYSWKSAGFLGGVEHAPGKAHHLGFRMMHLLVERQEMLRLIVHWGQAQDEDSNLRDELSSL